MRRPDGTTLKQYMREKRAGGSFTLSRMLQDISGGMRGGTMGGPPGSGAPTNLPGGGTQTVIQPGMSLTLNKMGGR